MSVALPRDVEEAIPSPPTGSEARGVGRMRLVVEVLCCAVTGEAPRSDLDTMGPGARRAVARACGYQLHEVASLTTEGAAEHAGLSALRELNVAPVQGEGENPRIHIILPDDVWVRLESVAMTAGWTMGETTRRILTAAFRGGVR